jgi:hypothetical protein
VLSIPLYQVMFAAERRFTCAELHRHADGPHLLRRLPPL